MDRKRQQPQLAAINLVDWTQVEKENYNLLIFFAFNIRECLVSPKDSIYNQYVIYQIIME